MIWLALAVIEVAVLLVYGRRAWARRWWNVMISLDQLVNAYGGGDPDETISSRAAKQTHKRGWDKLTRFLDWIDPGHAGRALEVDEGGRSAWD